MDFTQNEDTQENKNLSFDLYKSIISIPWFVDISDSSAYITVKCLI
jgi:hypothetical protein